MVRIDSSIVFFDTQTHSSSFVRNGFCRRQSDWLSCESQHGKPGKIVSNQIANPIFNFVRLLRNVLTACCREFTGASSTATLGETSGIYLHTFYCTK